MIIVKTYDLNFEDNELETLYIHQGEKGRAYLFVPPVDVSGLTCQVEIVKPDNTFVIQNLEYDGDGNVILEIPEQAGAVVGVGWYILSFKRDDVTIYSCYGRYQVDDHLISDNMIESIAEVNGYAFPDDFVTKDDINEVIANPDEEATDVLTKITIGHIVYSMPQGGGHKVVATNTITISGGAI